jgi:hypothetical protein
MEVEKQRLLDFDSEGACLVNDVSRKFPARLIPVPYPHQENDRKQEVGRKESASPPNDPNSAIGRHKERCIRRPDQSEVRS